MASTEVREDEPTIGRLVADASREISTLIRSEIALAKSELMISARSGGVGIGLLVAAGFVTLLSLILLSIAFAYLLTNWMHPAWAFLIVFGVYLLVAVILALVGVRMLKQVRPPERAIEQAQKSKQMLDRS
jgi:membrane protein implicated in regulation of membrane protease activity